MRRILENIKIAFKSLFLNKLRAFLTMLGIIIGVGAVVAVISVGAGAEATITENMQSVGTNILTISPASDTSMGPPERETGMRGRMLGQDSGEETVAGDLYLEDVYILKEKSSLLNTGFGLHHESWNISCEILGHESEFGHFLRLIVFRKFA